MCPLYEREVSFRVEASTRTMTKESSYYSTGHPSIRTLTREIVALGYEVSGFPLRHTDLRPLTLGVWHWAVVLGDIILFIVAPAAPSSSDSSSDQSGYESSPEDGYWRR